MNIRLEGVDYYVQQGKKQILHNVSLSFPANQLSCLMGPSGSGKTTCLQLILGHTSGELRNGSVLINGAAPQASFKSLAKLIPQEDVLLPSFSVRETLDYHAQLVLPQGTTREQREERVEEVMQSLWLLDCADVRIGDVEMRGISGGQRKRTSIAMELLSNAQVLCVDEPTTGLDSSNAENVVQILQHLALQRTVICTIHQPSFRIFNLFHQVHLLTHGGHVAYSGSVANIEPYFASIGHVVPEKENPCDHFMRLLQENELTLPEEFARQRKPDVALRESTPQPVSVQHYPISTISQVGILFKRQTSEYVRDRRKFARLMGSKLVIGMVYATVWYQKANPPRQSELQSINSALFMMVFNSTLQTLALTVITFPMQRSLMLREYLNGTYSLLSWYVATIGSMAMFAVLFVLGFALPVFFGVFGGGPSATWEKLGVFLCAMLLMTLIGNALGVSVGAASRDVMEAQNMLVPVIAPLVLFSGFILPKKNIPAWAMIFYKLSFFQYGVALFELNCFQQVEFVDYSKFDIFHPTRWRPFHSGEDWLKSLDLDPKHHHIWHYMLILAMFAFTLTVLGFFVVKRAVAPEMAECRMCF